ncbi:MAG: VTT domain-containing protein [Acidobacteriaceae bacterium]|nr:VTT domain-containing protein [Acidobacteriaceae bacterium]
MFPFHALLLRHGYWLLFGYIAAVEVGLPIPADPMLLLMGAMVGNGKYSFFLSLLVAVTATLIGDALWYEIGRDRGSPVLGLLCKVSLEPDTCVRKTKATFSKRGATALIFAKFVPGLGILSMALSGVTKMPRWKFLLADAAGSILWASSYLFLGRLFYRQVDDVVRWLGLFGQRAGLVFFTLLAVYAAVKYSQRRRFIRKLRINRVSAEQVHSWLDAGQPLLTIIDLRHPAEIGSEGEKIAGALILRPEELRSRSGEIPRDQEIILYCS